MRFVLPDSPGGCDPASLKDKIRAIISDVSDHEAFERLEFRLGEIMASIQDLANDVAALTAAVATLAAPTGTTIDEADQATLDSADAAVQQATAAVQAFVTPPAPAEPTA